MKDHVQHLFQTVRLMKTRLVMKVVEFTMRLIVLQLFPNVRSLIMKPQIMEVVFVVMILMSYLKEMYSTTIYHRAEEEE